MQFHRHVTKTGEIKDFVITEESGIAKGIRRIIGVTGNEAKEVRRLGDALKAKLDQAEKLDGKDKDAALRSLTVVGLFEFLTTGNSHFNSQFFRNSPLPTFHCCSRRISRRGSLRFAKPLTSR